MQLFIEETYEVCEAIDDEDTEHMKEELGDVLLQVVFHTEMEKEKGTFNINDVADGICKKLIFRHPHIFGSVEVGSSEEILKNSLPTENGVQLTVDGGATVKIIDNSKAFADTQNHWSKDDVDFVAARELFNGVGGNRFDVSGSMTRGMVNTVLARLAGANTEGGAKWYDKGTEWAVQRGISDGTNPTAPVTREQLATMLYRFAGSPDVSGDLTFKDASNISNYAKDAMLWAVQKGILNGMDGNRAAPGAKAERAQVAAMLARYLKNL